jgi:23S rRNA pseudouridine2605 synthase
MRLNQFLASAGFGSRRSCEQIILEGRVSVNGHVVKDLATRVSPGDRVMVDHKPVEKQQAMTLVLHKPKGVLCSTVPEGGRKTVFEFIPAKFPRLFYVGRLDAESEGLLVLTNDGDLAQKLTHPRYKLPKTYLVRLDKPFDFDKAPKFLKGFTIEPGFAKFDSIHRINPVELKVVLSQGLKRQIRHMFYRHGYEVEQLRRIRIGRLELGTLPPGAWRALTREEIARDLVAVGSSDSGESAPRPRPSGGPAGRPVPRSPNPATRRGPAPRGRKSARRKPGGPRRPRR